MEILETINIERQIVAIYHLYCEAVDTKEFERLEGVFSVDCKREYKHLDGTSEERDTDSSGESGHGYQILVKRLHRDLGAQTNIVTQHNVLNFRCKIHAPTSATARCNYYAVHKRLSDKDVFSAGVSIMTILP